MINPTPGLVVDILPAKDGSNFGNAKGWTVVGPTRHPYNVVVREPDHGTTCHVDIDRLIVAGSYGETPKVNTALVNHFPEAFGSGKTSALRDYCEATGRALHVERF
jgi:hypothetical protein